MIPSIPNISDTGAGYWPTVGTVPKGETYTGLQITSNVATQSDYCTIQVTANPGVDPIVPARPWLRRGDWIYAAGQLVQVKDLYPQNDDHTIYLRTEFPFSPAITAQAFDVVRPRFSNVSIVNDGAAAGEINGMPMPVGETVASDPHVYAASGGIPPWSYDATGTTLKIQVS